MGKRFWDAVYSIPSSHLPWYYAKLDPDLRKALKNIRYRTILSLGEGPGTQARALAKMGYTVTATDISSTAVNKAQKKMGHAVEFVVDDITKTKLRKQFPLIFDRGVFHSLKPRERPAYLRNVYRLLSPHGYLFLKTFHWKETFPGPRRFKPEELRKIFDKKFKIESIKETVYYGNLKRYPKALFMVMKKKT